MKESKPLLFIQSVNTETLGQYQTIYDSRNENIKEKPKGKRHKISEEVDPTIARKVELLINRANEDQAVLCNVVTEDENYKGIVIKSNNTHIYVEDETEQTHKIQLEEIKEIRIIKIDY